MKQRLHYFDILKGIAIFMVVMGHVIAFCVRDIDRATLIKFIGVIHMPLFFFISGWFTFKLLPDDRVRIPDLLQRAKQLLLPMLVVSSIWIFYFPHSGIETPFDSTFAGLWVAPMKNGYWFTFVLFQIIVLYALFAPLFGRLRSVWSALVAVTAIWAVLLGITTLMSPEVLGYSSFMLTAQFWFVFAVGAIAARHKDAFNRLTENGNAVAASLVVGAVLLYFISWPWEFDFLGGEYADIKMSVMLALFHICLAIVAIAVIRPWSQRIYAPGQDGLPVQSTGLRVAGIWQLLGRKSLAIYLLHYFFLFPAGICRPFLEGLNLSFTPLFFFSAFVATGIILIVLGVEAVLQRAPIMAWLLSGTLPAKPKVQVGKS